MTYILAFKFLMVVAGLGGGVAGFSDYEGAGRGGHGWVVDGERKCVICGGDHEATKEEKLMFARVRQ